MSLFLICLFFLLHSEKLVRTALLYDLWVSSIGFTLMYWSISYVHFLEGLFFFALFFFEMRNWYALPFLKMYRSLS